MLNVVSGVLLRFFFFAPRLVPFSLVQFPRALFLPFLPRARSRVIARSRVSAIESRAKIPRRVARELLRVTLAVITSRKCYRHHDLSAFIFLSFTSHCPFFPSIFSRSFFPHDVSVQFSSAETRENDLLLTNLVRDQLSNSTDNIIIYERAFLDFYLQHVLKGEIFIYFPKRYRRFYYRIICIWF